MASSNFLTEARNFSSLTLIIAAAISNAIFWLFCRKKYKNCGGGGGVLAIEKDTTKMANSKDHNELKREKKIYSFIPRSFSVS